jgi:sarcosine oxidase / L-pipecolate oxidase
MTDCALIVGGGVFGLASAWELAGRGWRVTVLDSGHVPRHAAASTDVSKIVRMDYGPDLHYTEMAEAAMAGWDEWNRRWSPPLYHEDGFALLASEPMQPGGFEYESYVLLASRGHPVVRLRDLDRTQAVPAWSEARYPDGYFNRRAGWAESGRVVERLKQEALIAGVEIDEHSRVASVIHEARPSCVVTTDDGRRRSADVLVIAAGAWTPSLLPHLRDVMWTTGQPVIHVNAGLDPRWRAPSFPVWAADIARTGWYGFPALADGALKIGHHGGGRPVDPDAPRLVLRDEEARVHEFLRDSLPDLAGAPIVHRRLCLYCDTFDGDFWIDRDPAHPGLVVAAGDSGHGFKFAPIIGGLVADVVEGKPNRWAGRFRWRQRLRDRREAARADA